MDGRIQEPILKYLKENYGVDYVDTITEPGVCRVIAEGKDKNVAASIVNKAKISVECHSSKVIAVSGHHDCAANPFGEKEQKDQIQKSIAYLKDFIKDAEFVGLWVDENWKVSKV
jgi:hypothetical protein